MISSRSLPRDTTLGIASGLLGLVFIAGAMAITPDPSTFNVLGPRVAPLVIGIATVVCSVALIVQGLRQGSRPETSPASPGSTAPDGGTASSLDEALTEVTAQERPNVRRLVATFGLFTGYILVFIPLGYVVSTFLFLTALTTYREPAKWLRNMVFAAGFAILVFLLFTRGLQVTLPPGILG